MSENKINPTKEQIEQWKLQYGRVFILKFPPRTRTIRNPKFGESDGEPEFIEETFASEKVAYLKKPTRQHLKFAQAALKKQNSELDFNETLLNNCWIDGDPEIKTDDAYILGAGAFIGNILDIADAELEEL